MPTRPRCSIDGCGGIHWARGYCSAHYDRWRRHGDPQADRPLKAHRAARGCSVDGCAGAHYARGWCPKHYARWWEGRPVDGGR